MIRYKVLKDKPKHLLSLRIALGFLFKKYGLDSYILAHSIFNLSMMGLGSYLIQDS